MLQKSAVSNYLSCCLEIMISLQFSHLLKAHTFVHYIWFRLCAIWSVGLVHWKLKFPPKILWYLKFIKIVAVVIWHFGYVWILLLKYIIALAPKLQILEDIREKDGRRIISWILKILHHESLQAKGNLLYVSCSNSSKKERKVYRESFFSALSWVNDPC